MGKQWKQWQTIFFGSKITVDGDCGHEIRRHLLLGRKAMTSLDSILKSRDFTLPTKVHLVKTMVFPVITYSCESWPIKEAEHQEVMFWTVVLVKTLESPLDSKEIKPVNLKGNQHWIFIGRTDAEASTFWPSMWRANSMEKTLMPGKTEGKRRSGQQRMRWLDGITDTMHVNLCKTLGCSKGQGSLVCWSSWGCKELDRT